jgi:hypothetical protein
MPGPVDHHGLSIDDSYDPLKSQWARYVARDKLDRDFRFLKAKISTATGESLAPNIEEFAKNAKQVTIGQPPRQAGNFKVGIIGAGCAGLFTALIFDHLNKEIPGLNISYDILEADEEKRLGGRLYTHKFSDAPHDYYDIGAMRFPNNKVMTR